MHSFRASARLKPPCTSTCLVLLSRAATFSPSVTHSRHMSTYDQSYSQCHSFHICLASATYAMYCPLPSAVLPTRPPSPEVGPGFPRLRPGASRTSASSPGWGRPWLRRGAPAAAQPRRGEPAESSPERALQACRDKELTCRGEAGGHAALHRSHRCTAPCCAVLRLTCRYPTTTTATATSTSTASTSTTTTTTPLPLHHFHSICTPFPNQHAGLYCTTRVALYRCQRQPTSRVQVSGPRRAARRGATRCGETGVISFIMCCVFSFIFMFQSYFFFCGETGVRLGGAPGGGRRQAPPRQGRGPPAA